MRVLNGVIDLTSHKVAFKTLYIVQSDEYASIGFRGIFYRASTIGAAMLSWNVVNYTYIPLRFVLDIHCLLSFVLAPHLRITM